MSCFLWWREHTFAKYGEEDEPSELPPTSAPKLSQAEPPEVTDLRRVMLTSFSFAAALKPSKVMLSCYSCCPTLGRMPRGCGPPPGSPQEAGPESAESLCTQVPAGRSFLHHIHFQWAPLQISTI